MFAFLTCFELNKMIRNAECLNSKLANTYIILFHYPEIPENFRKFSRNLIKLSQVLEKLSANKSASQLPTLIPTLAHCA